MIDLRSSYQGKWATRKAISLFVVHHTATPSTTTPQAIHNYHVSRGYPGIAYHYGIRPDGAIEWYNSDDLLTWHGNGANDTGLGVAVYGDFTHVPPNKAQLDSLRYLWRVKEREHGPLKIIGHREAPRAATACPGSTWPWNLEGNMKTTLHVQRIGGWMEPFMADMGSTWAKVVNPPEDGRRHFAQVPNLCVRFWTDDIDRAYISRGRDGGRDFVRMMAPRWRKCPATCYELANEPPCNTNQDLTDLREYTIGAILEANAQGLKLCILNLSEGNPHDNGTGQENVVTWKLQQLDPAVALAAIHGHWVGLHAYWRPGVTGPRGRYHALGEVVWKVEQWIAWGARNIKVLVNETGIDGGIANHPGQQGWQRLSDPHTYAHEIADAEDFARQFPWMQSLMLFTAGWEPPWNEFDIPEWYARELGLVLGARFSVQLPDVSQKDLEKMLGETMQRHIIPLNPDAALEKAAEARGQGTAVSLEVRDVPGYVMQAFRRPDRRDKQYIGYCRDGDWGNVRFFERDN